MAAHSVGLQDAISSPAFHGVLSTSENSCVLAKQEKCRLPQVSLSLSLSCLLLLTHKTRKDYQFSGSETFG